MLLLRAENLKKIYGDRTVLEVRELTVYTGNRIGVVGANGAGKSTLFQILAGELEPEEGLVQRYGGIAYCRQFEESSSDDAECFLSGGEEMRRKLAEVFAKERHVLLLDEPTANLDSEGIRRLLQQLGQVETFLCISHDRDLLTKVCTHILEVTEGKLHLYPGNYKDYEQQKREERDKAERDYEAYIEEKSRLQAVYRQKRESAERMVKIPKNMTPREARLRDFLTFSGRNSSGKQKNMNRAADNIKKRIEHMEVKEKPKQEALMRLAFERTDPPESKRVLELKDLTFAYGERVLFEQTGFSMSNRKRTALLGENGSGKTTLLRLLEEAYERDRAEADTLCRKVSGSETTQTEYALRFVPKARLGVLKQDFSQIDPKKTVLENAMADSVQLPAAVKSVLAGLLFDPDSWGKKAAVLSGGERMRLAFAMLLVSPANVLFLDEPTNYLDLQSIEALERQLVGYGGAVLFVSHDREFVRHTAQELVMIEERRLVKFAGTLTEYEKEQERKAERKKREGNQSLEGSENGQTAQKREEERLCLELRQAKLSGMLGHAPSLEEKERLEAEFWEITKRLRENESGR